MSVFWPTGLPIATTGPVRNYSRVRFYLGTNDIDPLVVHDMFAGTVRWTTYAGRSLWISNFHAIAAGAILQSVDGVLSFASGTINRQVNKIFNGTLSFVGSLTKRTDRAVAGALSFAGAVTNRTVKIVAGVLSFTGTLASVKLVLKAVEGALSFSGSLARQSVKPLAGVLSFVSGTISKGTSKALAGALSFAGAMSRLSSKALTGALSFAGAVTTASVFFRSLVGSLSFGGTLADNAKTIAGITKDSVGTALASCIVKLFRTATDAKVAEKTSDAGGNYSIKVASAAAHYAVAYKAGAPDVAGTTKNDVTGT